MSFLSKLFQRDKTDSKDRVTEQDKSKELTTSDTLESIKQGIGSIEKQLLEHDKRVVSLIENETIPVEEIVSALTRALNEQSEQVQTNARLMSDLSIREKELISYLLDGDYKTYEEISSHMKISHSRARAYISSMRIKNIPFLTKTINKKYLFALPEQVIEQVLKGDRAKVKR